MASSILIRSYPVLLYTLNELCQCAKKHRMSCTWNTHCVLSIHRFTKVLNFLQINVPVYMCVCVYVCVTRRERKNRLGVKKRLKNFLKISPLHRIDIYITILLYTVAM